MAGLLILVLAAGLFLAPEREQPRTAPTQSIILTVSDDDADIIARHPRFTDPG